MIDWTWINLDDNAFIMIIITAFSMYISLILFTRLWGIRSFSTISSFDFAITVTIGAVVAGTLLQKEPPLLNGLVALFSLYALQGMIAFIRLRLKTVKNFVDNQPVLLMAGDEILYENLKKASVTMDDLKATLRKANVIHPSQIKAVVMECTGDVSVLHSGNPELNLDHWLIQGVKGADKFDPLNK